MLFNRMKVFRLLQDLLSMKKQSDYQYVVDDLRWVQAKRLKYFTKYLPQYSFQMTTTHEFLPKWRRKRFGPAYISTWRTMHPTWKTDPELFTGERCRRVIAGVTSHSNIGGGLDPVIAIRPRTPEDAFRRAVDLLRKFKAITVNSSYLYELLSPAIDNVFYCPNGVDADFFSPVEKSYRPDAVRIGWVGKVRVAKNVEVIEAAREILEREGFIVKMIKVPKDSSEKEVLSAEQMREFYRGLDFYLCASWNEGTPNPALEAAACGVPVITTRVGNMRELIDPGVNGFFVEPNVESIVERCREIRAIEPSEYDNIQRAMREAIIRSWTWEKNIQNYVPVFELLCD